MPSLPAGSAERRVLVVDDDTELCQLLSEYLATEGYTVEAVHTGRHGVERALAGDHAIVVLDVMLPDLKGFEVLRRVRAESRRPILMLTARGDEQDRILGLEMGADDYLGKPFNPRELSARIEAVLRRSRPDASVDRHDVRLVVGDVSVDKGARVARRGEHALDLTTVEFDLLDLLLRGAGRVIPRDELVRTVLRREFSPFDRSIDTHVSNLRRKLGPAADGTERIKGVRGIGYQYALHHRVPGSPLMHRLHVKIFLWFWLGILVVSGTLVSLTELSHTRAEDDRAWEEKYTPRLDMWARQESQILRREGPAALERYVGSFEMDPGVANYIFDADGHEVLGRRASAPVLRLLQSMTDWPAGKPRIDPGERMIAERVIDGRGTPHIVVVDWPSPSVLNRSLFEFLSPDIYTERPSRATLGRILAVLAVAGVFCFLLARHIARPIDRLRMAARNIANQQLQTRVDDTVLERKDELADLGRDFDRMAERIEQLVTAQRHLLADVSHALRSPLARLNVALGLARQRTGPPSSEHLDRIEVEAERLNRLIGQLLTMARVDSGVDLERPTRFDLGGIVEEVSTDAEYEARTRQCAVAFSQRSPCVVEGAREMLRGAVENVVRNAVRHTADRTRVEVSLERAKADDGERAVIKVRDYGPGVPGDSVATLFVPFNRILTDGVSNPERTGLGLAITRRTFEVHGGTATAANAPEGGFIVTLELPVMGQPTA